MRNNNEQKRNLERVDYNIDNKYSVVNISNVSKRELRY